MPKDYPQYLSLRLFSSEDTPSLLLLRASADQTNPVRQKHHALQIEYVDAYFGQSLRVLQALYPDQDAVRVNHALGPPASESDVSLTYKQLIDFTATQGSSLLDDAFLLERTRYQLALTLTDFSEEFMDALKRPRAEEIQWEDTLFQLKPHTRIVQNRWDWGTWLDHDPKQDEVLPEEEAVFFLLCRKNNTIHARRISPFATLVLQELGDPASLDRVCSSVLAALEKTAGVDPETIRKSVLAQMQQAYHVNLIAYVQADANEKASPVEKTRGVFV